MARPLRVEYPGAIYHVTSRMVGSWQNERLLLFRDDRDFRRFVERLEACVEELNVRLYLFCLMSNHYHFLLETPEGNLSRFMQKLSTAYTVYFNRRHRRHGHVLDGRFKSKLVEGDEYLLKLSRYVHLNPVMVKRWKKRPVADRLAYLRRYRWSSYLDYIGRSNRYRFLDKGAVLAEMGGRVKDRPARYREFVESGMVEDDVDLREVLQASPLGIGDEAFRQWVRGLHTEVAAGRARPEDVSFRRTLAALAPDEVLGAVAKAVGEPVEAFGERRRNSPLRAVASKFLLRHAGLTQREVADFLGLGSGAAVSSQVKRYDTWLASDRKLRRAVEKLERDLGNARGKRQKRALTEQS